MLRYNFRRLSKFCQNVKQIAYNDLRIYAYFVNYVDFMTKDTCRMLTVV